MLLEDMAAKLSELLDSPEGLETVKSLAGALMGGGEGGKPALDFLEKPEEAAPVLGGLTEGLFSGISPNEIQAMMKIGSALKNQQVDERSKLLLALKPHLGAERQEKVDQAVKILKLVNLLPLLKDSGLTNLFGGLL